MERVPAVRRRRLGEELRRLRDLAGLTSGEAARLAGWHQSKVSRIETGRSSVTGQDVTVLLDVYGVRDRDLRDLLGTLAGKGYQRGWWHDFRHVLPVEYRDFISLETGASRARSMENSVVPGLLQTPDYARALTRDVMPHLGPREADALVDVRIARQAVLHQDPPLELHAVLDEAVLRRGVGGPAVMAGQLLRLEESARLPQVRLHVLPFTAGGHMGVTGSFVIFSFPPVADLDVVVVDHLTSSLYVDRKEDVLAYGAAFAALRDRALPPEESVAMIAGIRAELSREITRQGDSSDLGETAARKTDRLDPESRNTGPNTGNPHPDHRNTDRRTTGGRPTRHADSTDRRRPDSRTKEAS